MSMGVPGGGAGIWAGMSGDQWAGFTYREPIPMKAMTTVSLMATMMLLAVADSETPTVSRVVTAAITTMAGRFKIPVATTTPAWFLTSSPGAAVKAGGIAMCRSCIRLTK